MKLALIGAGRIGRVHALSIAAHPEVTLAAVVDAYLEGAEALAETSTPGSGASTRYSRIPRSTPC